VWLAIYNYRGAALRFWEYASLKGAFWRGNLRAGFVLEVAERHEFASAMDFLAHLRRTHIVDRTDDDLIRTISFSNDNSSLSLQYGLWHTNLVGRSLDGTPYTAPNLTSPLAIQGDSGTLSLGQARLYTQPQMV
jgi:hypothetical protein